MNRIFVRTIGLTSILIALAQIVAVPTVAAATWATEIADGQGDVGYVTGIALDANVHAVYLDAVHTAIRYARKTTAGWTTEEVARPGAHAAMALDASGNPHVSYTATTGNTSVLNYATKTGSAPWVIVTVDTSSTLLIRESSIVLGANGVPHISYRFGTRLKYATKTGGGPWATTVVDGAPPLNKFVGSYSSIALDASGKPRISYYNLTDKTLMYAEWTGTTWRKDTADFGGDIGWFTSLAVDSKGFPHISYYDSTNHRVKYISWDASGYGYWLQYPAGRGEVVDAVIPGWQTTIVVDNKNSPSIAYQGGASPNFELRYAARTGANKWTTEMVDTGDAGVGVSMKLDASGSPHISYSLLTPSSQPVSKLKHAYPTFMLYYIVIFIIFLVAAWAFYIAKKKKPAETRK